MGLLADKSIHLKKKNPSSPASQKTAGLFVNTIRSLYCTIVDNKGSGQALLV
jgi:hypothetical protein